MSYKAVATKILYYRCICRHIDLWNKSEKSAINLTFMVNVCTTKMQKQTIRGKIVFQ